MKILLASSNLCSDPYPVYPLGMSTVAGALAAAGHEVVQFDLRISGMDAFADILKSFAPAAVGISVRNIDTVNSRSSEHALFNTAVEMAKTVKKILPSAVTLLGGPAFTLLPDAMLKLSGADCGVSGEGELAMLELVSDIEKGAPLKRIYHGTRGPQAHALYQPDIAEYYIKQTHILPFQTKRGCPFSCVYCTYPALEGRLIRNCGIDYAVGRMEEMCASDPELLIYIVDAVFNDPAGDFRNLLAEMKRRRADIRFAAFISPSGLTDSDAGMMAECGLAAAELGVDASTDATLRGMGKDFTFSEARRACGMLTSRGVGVTVNAMFGGPGETYSTVAEGIDNILSLEGAYSMIFPGVRILPHTPLHRLAIGKGLVPTEWDGVSELYYFEPGLDREKLHCMLLEGFKGAKNAIYPPDAKNSELAAAHRIGYLRLRSLKEGNSAR